MRKTKLTNYVITGVSWSKFSRHELCLYLTFKDWWSLPYLIQAFWSSPTFCSLQIKQRLVSLLSPCRLSWLGTFVPAASGSTKRERTTTRTTATTTTAHTSYTQFTRRKTIHPLSSEQYKNILSHPPTDSPTGPPKQTQSGLKVPTTKTVKIGIQNVLVVSLSPKWTK